MRARVVCTVDLAIDLIAAIPEADVTIGPLADADAWITMVSDRVDAAALAAAPRLRIVANHAVGLDNVDVAACTARGVHVTNTPDVLTEATADLAFGLALAAARRLGEGERLIRRGGWSGWTPTQLLGQDVWGRVLGIVGLGRIGRAMAMRGKGFGMEVICAGGRDVSNYLGAKRVAMDELFAQADVVSLHCPLTPQTRGLVDARRLALMKPTAILVNTARGACVDEEALAAALREGRIAGAGLDVFAAEPAISPALLAEERVVLAPHIGSATTTTRIRMGQLCVNAVRAVLAGERPPNLVNEVR